jgi:hypothetical protein
MAGPRATPSSFYDRLEAELRRRLVALGFGPARERFPLAAEELEKNGFAPLTRTRRRRSYVVALVRGDGLASEQLRYLSDQYYNALGRERNELRAHPTLLRGLCVFVYERSPEPASVEFLMQRVRPRTLLAIIRSYPWVLDAGRGLVRRPRLTRAPFPVALLLECARSARQGS